MEKQKIILCDSYYLEVDDKNYTLRWIHEIEDKKTKEKKIVDTIDGYCGTIEQAVAFYIRKKLNRTLLEEKDADIIAHLENLARVTRDCIKEFKEMLDDNSRRHKTTKG